MFETTPLFYLIILALLIGLRHGFDLDHLATIDAITRTTAAHPTLSRSIGLLFSFGHGMVVILMSVIMGSGILQLSPSHTLELFGEWISIFFLFTFGLLNIYNLLGSPTSKRKVTMVDLISRYLIQNHYSGISIFGIGALFAVSFDTLSQVAILALSAATGAGVFFSFFIGMLFMLGMVVADGLNGLLVAQINFYGNRTSLIISKVIGFSIAFFSLTTGILELIRLIL